MEPARDVPLEAIPHPEDLPLETDLAAVETEIRPISLFQPLCNGIRTMHSFRRTDYSVHVVWDNGGWEKRRVLEPHQGHFYPSYFDELIRRGPDNWSARDFDYVARQLPMIYPALDIYQEREFADLTFGAASLPTMQPSVIADPWDPEKFSTGQKDAFLAALLAVRGAPGAPPAAALDEQVAFPGIAAWKPVRDSYFDRDEIRQLRWMLRTAHFYSQTVQQEDTHKYNYVFGIKNQAERPYRSLAERSKWKFSAWSHGQDTPPLEVHHRRYVDAFWASYFIPQVSARVNFPTQMFREHSHLISLASQTADRSTVSRSIISLLSDVTHSQAHAFWARYIGIMTAGRNTRVYVQPEYNNTSKYAVANLILDLLFPDYMKVSLGPVAKAELDAALNFGRVNVTPFTAQAVNEITVANANGTPAYSALAGHAPGGPNYAAGLWAKLDLFVAAIAGAGNSQLGNHAHLRLLTRFFDVRALYNMMYFCCHVSNYIGYDFVLTPPDVAAENAAANPNSVEIHFSASELISALLCLNPRPTIDARLAYDEDQQSVIIKYARDYEPCSGIAFEQAYEQIFWDYEIYAALSYCVNLFPLNAIQNEHLRGDIFGLALRELFDFDTAALFDFYGQTRGAIATPASRFGMIHNAALVPGLVTDPRPAAGFYRRVGHFVHRYVLCRGSDLELLPVAGYNNMYVVTHVAGQAPLDMQDITYATGTAALSMWRRNLVPRPRVAGGGTQPKVVDDATFVRPRYIRDNLADDIDLWAQESFPELDREQFSAGGLTKTGAARLLKLKTMPVVYIYSGIPLAQLHADLRSRLDLEILVVPHRMDAILWRPIEYGAGRVERAVMTSRPVLF